MFHNWAYIGHMSLCYTYRFYVSLEGLYWYYEPTLHFYPKSGVRVWGVGGSEKIQLIH